MTDYSATGREKLLEIDRGLYRRAAIPGAKTQKRYTGVMTVFPGSPDPRQPGLFLQFL